MDVLCRCGNAIIKSYGTKAKLRARIVLFEEHGAVAKCLSCGLEIPIPVSLIESVTPAIPKPKVPHYILSATVEKKTN